MPLNSYTVSSNMHSRCVRPNLNLENKHIFPTNPFLAGKEILTNGSLYIAHASQADGGTYVCIAQNSAGTAFGQIRLNIFSKTEITSKLKQIKLCFIEKKNKKVFVCSYIE